MRHAVTLALLLATGCASDPAAAPVETPADTTSGGDVSATDMTAPDSTDDVAEVPDDAATPDDTPADTTPEEDASAPDVAPTEDTSAPPPTLAGPCSPEERIGGFTVESQDEYSIVDGKVLTGVVPVSIPEPTDLDLGERCTLTKRRILFCDPGCGPNQTCGLDETCIAYPSSQDVGTVAITGLAGGDLSLTPKKPGNNYFDTDLPHPAFAAGAVVALASSGGAGDLDLHGIGVHDLPVTPMKWTLAEGEALPLEWAAPPEGATVPSAVIEVRMSVDQHGSSPATLTCTFDDTGSAEIPAVAVDALLAAGISGFPNGRLRRMTADHMDAAGGCVDLVVTSTREALVRVAGVTPCKSTADCPSGQVCDTVIELCE